MGPKEKKNLKFIDFYFLKMLNRTSCFIWIPYVQPFYLAKCAGEEDEESVILRRYKH